MANPTTNYGFVLPTPTDLVTDLPADFDVALQGVDTRLKALQPGTTLGDLAYSSATANTNTRLPIGSNGQVLAVVAGVPAWAATSDQTPLTTKGDLFTFTTVDARIGVGANNTVLTADSSEATGLKWAVASGGADPYLNNIASGATLGVNLVTPGRGSNFDSIVARTCYTPIYLPACTLDRITVRTQSWSGTYTVRLGIYNNSNGKPGTLLLDAGTVSANAANSDFSITISQVMTAGWYWLAANNQVQVVAGTKEFLSTRTSEIPGFFVGQGGPGFDRGAGYIQTGVTGAFTTASPTLAGSSENLILTYVRVA